MGHFLRREQRISRSKQELLLTYLESEPPLNDEEPLILLVMQVTRWTSLFSKDIFKSKEPTALTGGNFETDSADPQAARLAEPIFSAGDSDDLGSNRQDLAGFVHNGPFKSAVTAEPPRSIPSIVAETGQELMKFRQIDGLGLTANKQAHEASNSMGLFSGT